MLAGLELALKARDGGLAFLAPLLDPLAVHLKALEALLVPPRTRCDPCPRGGHSCVMCTAWVLRVK